MDLRRKVIRRCIGLWKKKRKKKQSSSPQQTKWKAYGNMKNVKYLYCALVTLWWCAMFVCFTLTLFRTLPLTPKRKASDDGRTWHQPVQNLLLLSHRAHTREHTHKRRDKEISFTPDVFFRFCFLLYSSPLCMLYLVSFARVFLIKCHVSVFAGSIISETKFQFRKLRRRPNAIVRKKLL